MNVEKTNAKNAKKNRVTVSVQTTSFEIAAVQTRALKFHYYIWCVCVTSAYSLKNLQMHWQTLGRVVLEIIKRMEKHFSVQRRNVRKGWICGFAFSVKLFSEVSSTVLLKTVIRY